ncbi:MAG: NADH-quinone oxidoreductase subunit C [Candidatus Brockarchaeota archaeon]|nr:NADH-quinone oxidoreductase subunit C [Candidatus Brockarchaeota archaeon]
MEKVKKALGKKAVEVTTPRQRRMFVTVKPRDYKATVKTLKDMGISHVSTITGLDTGEDLMILTHLFGLGVEVTVKTAVDRKDPVVSSITDLIPGAIFYEREVYDLLGVKFRGHPNLQRLVLPEDWPEDAYPLRKDFKVQRRD